MSSPDASTNAAPPAPASPAPAEGPSGRVCENCGLPLHGEHCYSCGQWTKGLVRHFSSILGDFFDTVLNLDSRVLRTLWPLFAKPGFLTLEYLAGRRVRYVTPMRLYLFLSIIAFFAMQMSVEVEEGDGSGDGIVTINGDTDTDSASDAIGRASTPAQVDAALAEAVKKLDTARARVKDTPGATVGMDVAEEMLRERAREQVAWLKAVDEAKTAGKPLPPAPDRKGEDFNFSFDGKPWDPKTNPIDFAWLPDAVNASLNRRMAHARDVLEDSDNKKKQVTDALLRVSPQVLFVLMPIFALMLKLAYLFKRRLYMEHLLVALHSHSFISLALVLALGIAGLQAWLAPTAGFWNGVLGWAMGLTIAWMPLYLLIMQKRVYGQGWPMTIIKYGVLGISYSVLLSFGLVVALLVGLLTL
jgi:hypothetical protein